MISVVGYVPREGQSFTMEAYLSFDGCYTIAELFDRYISGLPIPRRDSGFEDNDIDNPLDYDADIADFPTPYSDENVPSSDPPAPPVAPKSAAPAAPTSPSDSEQDV